MAEEAIKISSYYIEKKRGVYIETGSGVHLWIDQDTAHKIGLIENPDYRKLNDEDYAAYLKRIQKRNPQLLKDSVGRIILSVTVEAEYEKLGNLLEDKALNKAVQAFQEVSREDFQYIMTKISELPSDKTLDSKLSDLFRGMPLLKIVFRDQGPYNTALVCYEGLVVALDNLFTKIGFKWNVGMYHLSPYSSQVKIGDPMIDNLSKIKIIEEEVNEKLGRNRIAALKITPYFIGEKIRVVSTR